MIDINVSELVPHTGKMLLLDKVIEYDQESLVAEVLVRGDGLFNEGDKVPAWVGIEYMAQTIAAHGGMMCVLAGKPIQLGFLLGSRRYVSNISAFKVGEKLTITVSLLMEDQGLGVFDCQIVADGIDISAKLNVYQPTDDINKVMS